MDFRSPQLQSVLFDYATPTLFRCTVRYSRYLWLRSVFALVDNLNSGDYDGNAKIFLLCVNRLSRLDILKLIDNIEVIYLFKRYPSIKAVRELLGKVLTPRNSRLKDAIYARLAYQSRQTRAQSVRHRLAVETVSRCNSGWYLIFDTLTVDNSSYASVFSHHSYLLRDYLRTVQRAIARAGFGSFRTAQSSAKNYYSYFAVIESGSRTGRLHFHILHYCRFLPSDWLVDPNPRPGGCRREIMAMKALWKYGLSSPIAVRYSSSDSYGKLGWHYPCKRVGDRIVADEQGNPARVWRYCAKYLTKIYNSPTLLHKRSTIAGEWPWRVRLSRNLGMQLVDQLLMSNERLLAALKGSLSTQLAAVRMTRNLPLPPKTLLRQRAMKLLLRRHMMSLTTRKDLAAVLLAALPCRESLLPSRCGPSAKLPQVMLRASPPASFGMSMSPEVKDFEAQLQSRVRAAAISFRAVSYSLVQVLADYDRNYQSFRGVAKVSNVSRAV